MKKILSLLLLLACLTGRAQTINVVYNFSTFQLNPQMVRQMVMTPVFSFTTSSTNIISPDYATFYTSLAGSVTVSNVLTGYAYQVKFQGINSTLTITNWFSTNLTGTVDAYTNLQPNAGTYGAQLITYNITNNYYATNVPTGVLTNGANGYFASVTATNGMTNYGPLVVSGGTINSGDIQFLTDFTYFRDASDNPSIDPNERNLFSVGSVENESYYGNAILFPTGLTNNGPSVLKGAITATNAANALTGTFTGNAAGLTNLNAANINPSGNLTVAGLTNTGPVSLAGNIFQVHLDNNATLVGGFTNGGTASLNSGALISDATGNLLVNSTITGNGITNKGTYYGNGAGLTNIPGSSLTGTISANVMVPTNTLSVINTNIIPLGQSAQETTGYTYRDGDGVTAGGQVRGATVVYNGPNTNYTCGLLVSAFTTTITGGGSKHGGGLWWVSTNGMFFYSTTNFPGLWNSEPYLSGAFNYAGQQALPGPFIWYTNLSGGAWIFSSVLGGGTRYDTNVTGSSDYHTVSSQNWVSGKLALSWGNYPLFVTLTNSPATYRTNRFDGLTTYNSDVVAQGIDGIAPPITMIPQHVPPVVTPCAFVGDNNGSLWFGVANTSVGYTNWTSVKLQIPIFFDPNPANATVSLPQNYFTNSLTDPTVVGGYGTLCVHVTACANLAVFDSGGNLEDGPYTIVSGSDHITLPPGWYLTNTSITATAYNVP